MENRTFGVTLITERLCEICDRVIDNKRKGDEYDHISDCRDYNNLLMRAKVNDRAEVDIEKRDSLSHSRLSKDVQPSCIENL